jgi:ATP-binding cassette subfamily B (MDR/TAP) protein 1
VSRAVPSSRVLSLPSFEFHSLASVLRSNIGYFDAVGAGEITNRIEVDTLLVQEGTSEKIALAAVYISTFIAGFAIAVRFSLILAVLAVRTHLYRLQLATNWRLALVLSCIIPIIVFTGAVMDTVMAKAKQGQLEANGKGATLVEEAYSSVRTIKAFGVEDVLTRMYDKYNLKTFVSSPLSPDHSATDCPRRQ